MGDHKIRPMRRVTVFLPSLLCLLETKQLQGLLQDKRQFWKQGHFGQKAQGHSGSYFS